MSYDPMDFFSGGGAPALSWKGVQPGTVYKGKILNQIVEDQTDDDGNVKTFKSGDPMKQLVLTIQTELRNGEGMSQMAKERMKNLSDDDGQRRLYVKGYMTKAVKDAVLAAGERGTKPGGFIAVKYTGDGEATSAMRQAPKLYTAKYEAPSVELDDFGDEMAPVPTTKTPAMAGAPAVTLDDADF